MRFCRAKLDVRAFGLKRGYAVLSFTCAQFGRVKRVGVGKVNDLATYAPRN